MKCECSYELQSEPSKRTVFFSRKTYFLCKIIRLRLIYFLHKKNPNFFFITIFNEVVVEYRKVFSNIKGF